MSERFSRRSLLGHSLLAGASAVLPAKFDTAPTLQLRIAHLTDTHMTVDAKARTGFERALEAAQSVSPKPDVVVFGGDEIMDAFAVDESGTRAQWDSYRSVKRANLEVPAIHTIGNHDVWGWNQERSGATGREPLFGKAWSLQEFELERPYYSRMVKGWKIIVLDSTFRVGQAYEARMDEEQFEWLTSELEGTPADTPVLVSSHIPLVCVCGFVDGDRTSKGYWDIPASWMHMDFLRVKNLFAKHPQVKGALSGHMHQSDMARFLGVDYFSTLAVSGAWWDGDYYEFGAGFAIVDCFSDGRVTCAYREI